MEWDRSVSMALNYIINSATANGKTAPDNRTWDLLKHYAAYVSYNDILQSERQLQNQGIRR